MAITKATQSVIAPITSTGTTTPRNLSDRFADVFNVKDFGAVGDGVTDDTAAIQAAISSIGSNNGSIFIPKGIYLINQNITISNDINLESGAKLKPASGITITIQSSITANDYTIFDFSIGGSISLTRRSRIARLAWFGVSPNETAANNTSAFDSAISACPTSDGAELIFPAGTIESNGFQINKSGINVIGHNSGTWLVNNTTNLPCISIVGTTGKISWCSIKNLRIGQKSGIIPITGNCGVRVQNTYFATISDVVCFEYPSAMQRGFVFTDSDEISLFNLKAQGHLSHGFEWSANAGTVTGTYGTALFSFNNGGSGFVFEGCSGFVASQLHAYNNGSHAFHWPDTNSSYVNQFFQATSWVGDTSASYNWNISKLNRSSFSDCWASTQKNNTINTFATGLVISGQNAREITFSNLIAIYNNASGVLLTNNSNNIKFIGCQFGGLSATGLSQGNGQSGSGAGIRIENVTDITVTGCRSFSNASQGLVLTAAASDYCIITSNNLRGNTGTSLLNASTGLNNILANNVI